MSVMNERYSRDLTVVGSWRMISRVSSAVSTPGFAKDCSAQPCPDGYECVGCNCLWARPGAPRAEMETDCERADGGAPDGCGGHDAGLGGAMPLKAALAAMQGRGAMPLKAALAAMQGSGAMLLTAALGVTTASAAMNAVCRPLLAPFRSTPRDVPPRGPMRRGPSVQGG